MAIYKLGEICELKSGLKPNKDLNKYLTNDKNEGIPWVKQSDVKNNKLKSTKIYFKNEFLKLTKVANKEGLFFFPDCNPIPFTSDIIFAFDPHIWEIINKDLVVSKKYMFFLLLANKKRLESKMTGTTMKFLTKSTFLNFIVKIPYLDMQQKIIDIIEPAEELFKRFWKFIRIDTLENAKKDLQKIIDIIEPLEKSLELNKIKFLMKKKLLDFYSNFLMDFPFYKVKHSTYKLKEIGSFKGGISSLKKEKYDKGVYFVNYMDIFKNTKITDKTPLRLYDANKLEIERYLVEFGDALFTASSENSKEIAMSSIYLSDKKAIFNGFSKIYKYDQNILNPIFASFLFRNNDFRKQASSLSKGYTRFNMSQSNLMEINVKIPDLKIQQEIISIIEPLEKEISLLEKEIKLLELQFKYYCNKFLKGVS